MKVLHLTLTKKWFDMILYGGKDDEYREIKPYWIPRLRGRHFDAVEYTNGYGRHLPKFTRACNGISEGQGLLKWGAPVNKSVFRIHMGKLLSMKNIRPDGLTNKEIIK